MWKEPKGKKEPKELKPKEVASRIGLLKLVNYKGARIWIRLIDKEIFEYIVVFQGELYTDYLVITAKKGSKELTGKEINAAAALIFTGAVTTVEELIKKLDKDYLKQEKESVARPN